MQNVEQSKIEIFDGNIFLTRLAALRESSLYLGDWTKEGEIETALTLRDTLENLWDQVQEALDNKFITDKTALELVRRVHEAQQPVNDWIANVCKESKPKVKA